MLARVDDIQVIKTPQEFQGLREEWQALWNRAKGQHHESFIVSWLSWIHVAKPMGRSLRIIAARSHGQLIAVWPLVRSRDLLWTVLRPLSSGSTDHTTVLADPDYASDALTEAVWRIARRQCASDMMLLDYVDRDSHLYQLAMAQRGLMMATESVYAVAQLSRETDWESFVASLGTLSGRKPGALRRRLEREGKADLRILGPEDAAENTRMIDWMLARKREWAEHMQKKGPWLYSGMFREYLVALANDPAGHREANARMMVLTLNDTPIAASMIGLGQASVLGLIAGFDREYAKYGPGTITTEAWMRWALERQRDLDLGIGSEAYKPYWSKGNIIPASRIHIALSAWGRVAFTIRGVAKVLARARAGMVRGALPNRAATQDLRPG